MAKPKIHINEDETKAYVCYLNKAKQKLTVVFSYDFQAREDIEERMNGSILSFDEGITFNADIFLQSKKGFLKQKYGEPELLESLTSWVVRNNHNNGKIKRDINHPVDLKTNLQNTEFTSSIDEATALVARAQKDLLDFYPEYLKEKQEKHQKFAKQKVKASDSIQKTIAHQKLIKFSSKEK